MIATLRLLFVGDVVGERGCAAVQALVPRLRRELELDAVIVNGENSAGGLGITADTGEALLSAADFLTLGDHAFDREGAGEYLDREPRVVRPANLEVGLPGRGWGVFEAAGKRIGVTNAQGRVFMRAPYSPFEAANRAVAELEAAGAEIILVDVHAEATSEKQAMGWYLSGRVTAVLGTHTHVPTADLRVLPGGTAYATDVGMTGGVDSIIGFAREDWLRFFLEGGSLPETVDDGRVRLDAVLLEVDGLRAVSIERVSREWSG
jgi:2',3'-cyclic-nucleotide 2'-phosphodiesterase